MKQGNFLNILRPNNLLFYILLIIFVAITFYFSPAVASAELICVLALVIIHRLTASTRNAKISEYLKDLSLSSDSLSKQFALNSILPVAIVKNNADVIWYNNKFAEIFYADEEAAPARVKELVKALPHLKKDEKHFETVVSIKDMHFNALGTAIETKDNKDSYIMVYFLDISEEVRLKKRVDNKSIVFARVVIDNYEETIGVLPEGDRAVVRADLDKHIYGWANSNHSFIHKMEKDCFLLVFEKQHLSRYLSSEFEKLRKIKLSAEVGPVNITLSIGIGADCENPVEANQYSTSSIDMALGRGGDQVVLKNSEGFSFFGGASKEVEKRTKVRSRVVAHALRELIENKDNVIVMGHKNPDIDFFGSALGIFRAVKTFGKKCCIILDEVTPSIEDIYNTVHQNDLYADMIINKTQAEVLLNESSMLVILDTHRPSMMPYPELIEHTETVVMIDHHRKSADFYSGAVLSYHEPYASSAAELVAEILQYISEDAKPNQIESTALYAGILLDTRNFTFKTGVRTFEAASYLRRCGLSTVEAKDVLKPDLNAYKMRNRIVSAAEIYKSSIAISCYNEEVKSPAVPAQAADELLNIKGITAAFVIYKMEGIYGISARSIGDINVQVVMEKLGGGGHQLSAGAQFESEDSEAVREALTGVIDEYLDEKSKG